MTFVVKCSEMTYLHINTYKSDKKLLFQVTYLYILAHHCACAFQFFCSAWHGFRLIFWSLQIEYDAVLFLVYHNIIATSYNFKWKALKCKPSARCKSTGLDSREKAWPGLRITCTSACAFYRIWRWPTEDGHTVQEVLDLSATERIQRNPHKYFDFRCPLSAWYGFQNEQTLERWDVERTHTHTHRPNYSNPRCACAPRVKNPQEWGKSYLRRRKPVAATILS